MLGDRVRVLGAQHPDVLDTLHFLGLAHAINGDLAESIRLLEQVVSSHHGQSESPPGETSLITTRGRMANAYVAASRFNDAARMLQRNLTELRQTHGPNAPITQAARAQLDELRARVRGKNRG